MSKHHVTTTINGEPTEFLCEPQLTLLDVLRDELRLTGSKEGCSSGDCGACSVTVDGRLVCSCLMLAVQAEGKSIQTVEGLARGHDLHPLQQIPRACRASMRLLHAGRAGRLEGAARPQPGSEENRSSLLACG